MEQAMRTLWLGCGTGLVVLVSMAVGSLAEFDQWPNDDDRELRQEFGALERLAQVRTRLIEELLAGHRSLFEVAAGFRELSQQSSGDLLRYVRVFHPGRSEEELYYLHVLMHVHAACRRDGSDETFIQALWQEFEARRASGTLTVENHDENSSTSHTAPLAAEAHRRAKD